MKTDETDSVTNHNELVTNSYNLGRILGRINELEKETTTENTPNPEIDSEIEANKKSCNKKYQYHRINLVIQGKNAEMLKNCCKCFNIDYKRVEEDHQASVIWELLEILEPILDARYRVKDEIRDKIKLFKFSREDLF